MTTAEAQDEFPTIFSILQAVALFRREIGDPKSIHLGLVKYTAYHEEALRHPDIENNPSGIATGSICLIPIFFKESPGVTVA